MEKNLKLGSLFDGSGGFPLAGAMHGIEPVWASEIEPFPIAVTKQRFPNMKHLGSVVDVKGDEVEPVDIITFGSPCQDLSVAGKQAGIHDGERSNLFFEAIRIIKEMRNATANEFPRFAVWENVCFSEDTLITCETGYKRIKDVCIGENVKTLSGEYHPVVEKYETPNKPTLVISVSGSEDLVCTSNHPFFTCEKKHIGKRRYFTSPHWARADELTKESMIAYVLDEQSLPDDFIDEAHAWAIGRWLADGSVDLKKSNPRIFISVGNSKIDVARMKLNQLPYQIHENLPHKTATNFCFTSAEFYELIRDAGIGAGNKRIPSYVFKLSQRLQRAVLEGYMSGDGYERTRGNCIEIAASTASRELAYGISRLIRNVLHVAANISVHEPKDCMIDGRVLKAHYPSYTVTASKTNKVTTAYFDGRILWQQVKNVAEGKSQTVYNLSVSEDNTYGANDIFVHNCGAFSSNKGEDFKAVLNAFCSVCDGTADVPRPADGVWQPAGCVLGDGYSFAWRVYDAQYWGVPKRRKRIYALADFRSERAGEILFKPDSMCWDYQTGREARERAAGYASGSFDGSDWPCWWPEHH